ncbi:peptide chain release factor N(5)-glutamine methyltransferase [Microcoleus sp. FACHB-1515]|uniref:peptide chain release factor N(5)-glutamine methyltransferase n=1 Tax=Cyanophyceae TaxID=3028117 RepID=UPI001681F04C|nr:peptide chain release factor N(5)-glutamine methyltransferase [Microcoleus sp. FACHB-1515]MBD2092514.1 peptide chain release factor N(5)-glutamine methyltransferase [Microcoleus sp. FACHB-1515]
MVWVSAAAIAQWRQTAQQQAIAAAISPAEVDWLLQALTGLDRLSLRLNSLPEAIELPFDLRELEALWQRRIGDRVPVQYLAQSTPWRQFSLQVSPAVLIPRPETELLIDLAVQAAKSADLMRGDWADLGTGSGAIAIGLAAALPEATIHAVDISSEALAIAQANATALHFDRIQFHHGRWFEPLAPWQGQLSAIVSNPPYIPTAMLADLQPEVRLHEPQLALDGGTDGLSAIRHLAIEAPKYLRSNGLWLIEMMSGQAEAVRDLLQQHGYQQIEIHSDLAGIDRFALAFTRSS